MNDGGTTGKCLCGESMTLTLHKYMDVIYEQRERVFYRDIQTRENNGAQRECFVHCFRVFGYIPVKQ